MSRLYDIKKAIDAATKVPLGELIEQVSIKAGYKVSDIAGVDINKAFIVSHANLSESDTSKYKVVKQWNFACNLMHIGRDMKIPVAINTSDVDLYVSPAYYVFKVKNNVEILPLYLYLELNRCEFDRLTWFYSDSSVRGNLKEERFHDIRIPLPPLDVQKEYVDAYDGLQQLIQQNEALLKPLSDTCQAYMAEVKSKYEEVSLGDYIESVDVRNTDGKYTINDVRGLSTQKQIIETKANMDGVSTVSYKLLSPEQFAYVADTSRRGEKISLGFNSGADIFLVSSISIVFRVKDIYQLDPMYLYLFFCRPEFDRYSRFNSWGSAREAFSFDEMCRVRIPLPPLDVQKSIVALHKCAEEARSIAAEARETLRKMCPAMVQRAAHDIR